MRRCILFANYSCRFWRSSVLRVNLHTKSLRDNVNLDSPRFRRDHTWHETRTSSRTWLAHNIRYRSYCPQRVTNSMQHSTFEETVETPLVLHGPRSSITLPTTPRHQSPFWVIPKLIQSTLSTLTCLLTYSMEQCPSCEVYRFLASQEIPHILQNPKVYYRICVGPCHHGMARLPSGCGWRNGLQYGG